MTKIHAQQSVDYIAATFHSQIKDIPKSKHFPIEFALICIAVIGLLSLMSVIYTLDKSKKAEFMEKCANAGNSIEQCEYEILKTKNSTYMPIMIPMRSK